MNRCFGGRGVFRAVVLAAVALFLAAGCGKSDEDKAAKNGRESHREDDRKVVGVPTDGEAPSPMQYLKLAVSARTRAQMVLCASTLRSIGNAMLLYQGANAGKMPASLEDLVKDGLIAEEMLNSPVPGGGPFAYIAGQKLSMNGDNILVYDPKVIYVNQCVALKLNGAVVALSPADLDKAVAETHERLAGRK